MIWKVKIIRRDIEENFNIMHKSIILDFAATAFLICTKLMSKSDIFMWLNIISNLQISILRNIKSYKLGKII